MKPLPEPVEAFLNEYEALCKKHGLMVLSDGEEVEVAPHEPDLWRIRRTTAEKVWGWWK